jgi:predicted GNAT family N-acyltransferase
VLDLLTHYDQPRAAFEPWYEHDPAYRPEQSLLAETNGRLVAHLRIYPRRLRLGGGATMRVAGIGNVITAREARRQGHADRLLRAAMRRVSSEAAIESCALSAGPVIAVPRKVIG